MEEASRGASTSGDSHSAEHRLQDTTAAPVAAAAPPGAATAFVTVPPDAADARILQSSSGTWLCCVPCYWLRRNNSVHKASLTVATLLVTSLLVASPVLFLISSVPGSDLNRDCFPQTNDRCTYDSGPVQNVCDSPTCKIVAAQILVATDLRKSACQDFYKFACGGRSSSESQDGALSLATMQSAVNLQLQNMLAVNATDWPFQKLSRFYKNCLQTHSKPVSFEPLYTFLEELGGYLPPSTLGPSDLTPLVARLLRVNGAPLVDVYTDHDHVDRSISAVFVDIPRPHPLPSLLFRDGLPDDLPGLNRSAEMLALLQGFIPKKMADKQRDAEYGNILSFTNKLTKLYKEVEEVTQNQRRDLFQRFNLSRLQIEYTYLNWERLFEEVLSINISESDILYVISPSYLTKLEDLISKFHKRIVHNSLLMMYARDTLHGIVNSTGRALPAFCMQLTTSAFSEAMGALYLRQFPPFYLRHLTRKVATLFDRLKGTLAERMRALNWMDEATRAAALAKLKALRGQYLTWPMLCNLTYVAENLKNVQLSAANFFGDVINRFRQLRSGPQEFPADKLWAYPFIVNAFYIPTENVIVIPVALLTQVYFRNDIPEYLSYATVGNIFLHEILHGFDLYGIGFDGNGTRKDWFTPESRLGLEARVDCVARQYASVFSKKTRDKDGHIQFDWNVTRNENMADIGALQTVYQAWRTVQEELVNQKPSQSLPGLPLGPKQLFFLAAAQMYCSTQTLQTASSDQSLWHFSCRERINGIMMNSPSFSEVYSCTLGSPMNPPKKCSTW